MGSISWSDHGIVYYLINNLELNNEILVTGPATEIMSTSFTQDSPTEPTSPESADKRDTAAELLKEWDSDSDSHTSNSSSGEFIWKVSGRGLGGKGGTWF